MIDPEIIAVQIRTALQPNSQPVFRKVGGAAEAAGLMDGTVNLGDGPAAFVVPLADREIGPAGDDDSAQTMEANFGVVIMVRKAGDASGAGGMAKISTLQRQLQAVLLGWTPDDEFLPFKAAGGRLLDFQPQALWWMEMFSSRYGIIAEPV